MNTLEAIAARRAVRSYRPEPVDEATVRRLLHAAVLAPSAMNAQPWRFAVIQNIAQLKRYSDKARALLLERMQEDPKAARYRELLSNPSFNVFYDANTLIVIGVDEPGPYADADCWLAAENLLLAATEEKLGTCCIGFAVPVLNTDDVKREIGFKPSGVAIAPIIVGRPSTEPPVVPRSDPKVVSWSR